MPAPRKYTSGLCTAYTYDANGNVTQEGQFGRSYTWDGRNLPLTITTAPPPPVTGTASLTVPSRSEPTVAGSVSLTAGSRSEPVLSGTPNLTAPARGVGPQTSTVETYTYDADGQRVTRTAAGITTLYIGGIFEQDVPSNLDR